MTRRCFLRRAAALAGGTALPAGMARAAAAPDLQAPQWVFLITIDTLRADHLSCYGYPRRTTPFLDRLADEGVLFERAMSSTSRTVPAHLSIFTSLELPQHRIHQNATKSVDSSLWMMTEMFREAGYETAAFGSVPFLEALGRGFDEFNLPPGGKNSVQKYRQAQYTIGQASIWLREHRDSDRFFMWIHLYDPHRPHRAPYILDEAMRRGNPVSDYVVRHWLEAQQKSLTCWPYEGDLNAFCEDQHLYDTETLFADGELRRFYEQVERLGPRQRKLWIFTADHGEGMGGHDYQGHGREIYQDQLHVPLIFHSSPKMFPNGRVGGLTGHVDIFPTLADLLGVPMDRQAVPVSGMSRTPCLFGDAQAQDAAERYAHRPHKDSRTAKQRRWEDDEIYCLLRGDFKYIYRTETSHQFYNLRDDPRETRNLIDDATMLDEADAMRKRAITRFAELTKNGEEVKDGEQTDAFDEDLEALGYL